MEKSKPVVAVFKSDYKSLYDIIEKVFQQVAYKPTKNDFFIKPNIVGKYKGESGIITSPKFTEAIIRYLRTNYPLSEIVIGEASARPGQMDKVFEISGYKKLAKKYNVKLVDLEKVKTGDYTYTDGVLKLPEIIETHEYINIAKLKTHVQTSVTLCLKNQKGLLSINTKKAFHSTHNLFQSIQHLGRKAVPDINFIDGIVALEGNGPSSMGTRKIANLVLASKNIYAIDNAAVRIMGFDINKIEHIPKFTDYKITGDKITDCRILFKKPDTLIEVPFYNIRLNFDKTCCSICSLSFSDAVKPTLSNLLFIIKAKFSKSIKIKREIIFGKYNPKIKAGTRYICFGECTRKLAEKENLLFIKGCPPTINDIQKNL
jgi:uncharacterized protein (DUF362 family)